jgi:hypothetical protein
VILMSVVIVKDMCVQVKLHCAFHGVMVFYKYNLHVNCNIILC